MTTSSVSSLVQPLGEMPPDTIVFGRTEAMQAVRDRLTKLAGANVPVLIQGESGTGKDIIARMIHTASPWRTGPWVKVNCPAIPGTLLESELFGYEKGAFTGAYGMKPGRVEMAHRGTLFLDEISELDLGAAVEAAATPAGRPVLPHRRAGRQESRSPRGLRDESQARTGNRKRHIPLRSCSTASTW